MPTNDNTVFQKTALQAALGGSSKVADFVTLTTNPLAAGDVYEGAVRLNLVATGAAAPALSQVNHPGIIQLDTPAPADAAVLVADPVDSNIATQSYSATAVLEVTAVSGSDVGCGLAIGALSPLATAGVPRIQVVADSITNAWVVEIDDGVTLVQAPVAVWVLNTWYRLTISVTTTRVEISIDGEVVYTSTNQPLTQANLECGVVAGALDIATVNVDLVAYSLTGVQR